MRRAAHVYFCRAALADRRTIDGYLRRAYELGATTAKQECSLPPRAGVSLVEVDLPARDDEEKRNATIGALASREREQRSNDVGRSWFAQSNFPRVPGSVKLRLRSHDREDGS